MFWYHNRLCRTVDVVLAFLPEASIGTAIEMFEAYEHGRIVVVVSPMQHNWAVKFLSHLLYADLEEFERAVRSGEFGRSWKSCCAARESGSLSLHRMMPKADKINHCVKA